MVSRRYAPRLVLMIVVTLVAACTWGGAAVAAEPEADKTPSYLRVVRDAADTPTALDVAIVRFAPKDGRQGPTVDLVSAVHVGDATYYQELNRRFEKYEVVLYELVAPEGTTIPEGKRLEAKHPVSFIQKMLKDVLNLEYQLEAVRYNRPNMVHADMTPQQLAESMRRRGESVLGMFFRMMGYAMAQQQNDPSRAAEGQFLMALFDRNRALALKRVMAGQFEDVEGTMLAIGGPEGSTLIEERNKVALEVLRREIAAGKQSIAVFYGAGHMIDFHQRLLAEFGMAPVKTEWVTAWDMSGKQAR